MSSHNQGSWSDGGVSEGVPLKDRNDAILFSGLYVPIRDWLALCVNSPRAGSDSAQTRWVQRIRGMDWCQSLNALTTPGPRTELAEHLRAVTHGMREVTNAELDAAVGQTIDEIGILLRDARLGPFPYNPPSRRPRLLMCSFDGLSEDSDGPT